MAYVTPEEAAREFARTRDIPANEEIKLTNAFRADRIALLEDVWRTARLSGAPVMDVIHTKFAELQPEPEKPKVVRLSKLPHGQRFMLFDQSQHGTNVFRVVTEYAGWALCHDNGHRAFVFHLDTLVVPVDVK